jgi:hypothetical protein
MKIAVSQLKDEVNVEEASRQESRRSAQDLPAS